jgi:RNA polymerase sigma-70 factor (ECF subfamily)
MTARASPNHAEERELVTAAQTGDRQATDRLLRDHQARIHAVCRRITGNDADALDATQEAMIAVVRGLPRFDGRSRFSTRAYRMATNTCLDELRRRRRRPVIGLPEHHDMGTDVVDERDAPTADRVADRMLLDRALAGLPEDFRAAVVPRDLGQLDHAEIADVLQIQPGTVRSRIARGRAHLADRLAGNQQGAGQRPTPMP